MSVGGCRRDYETRPLKMSLLAEIRAHPHRKDPSWVPEPESPIDYCYVRPNHIPSVNSMCHDMFWPGKSDDAFKLPARLVTYRTLAKG